MAVAGALQQHAHRRGVVTSHSSRPQVSAARPAAPARLAPPPRCRAALPCPAQAWGQQHYASAQGHDTARLGLLALMKVIAASKVASQASTSVATTTWPPAPAVVAAAPRSIAPGPTASAAPCAPACACAASQQHAGPAQLSTPPHLAAATGDVATAAHHATASSQPRLVPTTDPAVAAALWAEELRLLQARRQHLTAEVADLLALRKQQQQHRYAPTSSVEEALFVDEGAEFCPTTCQVETAPDVRQARQALAQHIAALATSWAPAASAASATHQQQPHASARQLQAQWEDAGLQVTHLLVRLAVLQQLPAQPKQRLTARHAKEEVLAYLRTRLANLATAHPQQQQHSAPSVPPPSSALPPRLMPSQPSQWQVDAPHAYVPASRHWQ